MNNNNHNNNRNNITLVNLKNGYKLSNGFLRFSSICATKHSRDWTKTIVLEQQD